MGQSESCKIYDRRMEDLECHYQKLVEVIEQRFAEMMLSAEAWRLYEIQQMRRWKSYEARKLWFKLRKEYAEEKYGIPKLIKVQHGMVLFA